MVKELKENLAKNNIEIKNVFEFLIGVDNLAI